MKKRMILPLFTALAIIVSALFAVGVYADEKEEILSPALHVIAAESSMAKAAMRGCELSFDKNDFARALNVSKPDGITVTSIPKVGEGKLFVGSTVVNEGQSISAANLSLLSFRADSDKVEKSSFTFSPEGESYEIVCNIYMLDKANYAPTLSLASSASLNVSTYENITHFGKLSAYDPDGDELIFEIVSYPKEGVLVLSDKTSGEYKYVPSANYTGKDSFTYVAKDKYGNYSAASSVNLKVDRLSVSTVYEDMKNSKYHSSALYMTEEGIMSGTLVGDGYYFYPDATVSRAEFVVMAMKALGIESAEGGAQTTFADNGDIPSSMRDYISAAHKLGYVNGVSTESGVCFLPNESISRAEAAVIVSRMIDASVPTVTPVFSDAEDIPAWAQSAVYSTSHLGLLDTQNGEIRPTALLTRAQTAGMLGNMMKSN